MKRNKQNRRKFLKNSAALGGGVLALGSGVPSLLNPRVAHATPTVPGTDPDFVPRDHYFVFYQFHGAWDLLLSWDTRDPAIFTPAKVGETGIELAFEQLLTVPNHGIYIDSNLGPFGGFVGDLRLPKYTDKMCLINGINMETLSHEGGLLRSLTGRMPLGAIPTRDSTDVVLSTLLGNDKQIPNIGLGSIKSVNEYGPSSATALRASSTSGFLANLSRSNKMTPSLEEQISNLLAQQGGCDLKHSSDFLQKAYASSEAVEQTLDSNLSELFDFGANTSFAQEIRAHYGFGSNELSGIEARTALAEQALLNQLSRCINIQVPGPNNGGFDTHTTLEQGMEQMAAYNSIARLMDRLEAIPFPDESGDNWLDHTTIVCLSEFSRGPRIEPDGNGRGHWLANSMVLLGGGFKTNQVVGATHDVGLVPMRVDFQTGQVSESGEIMTPDNVVRTFYEMLGYTWDVADLRCDPIAALLKDS